MHKKEKSCLGVRELLEHKGKRGTHFSGTSFQCSPRHRSRHCCGHSDHRSYRGGCKQLGKERKCSVHQNRGDQHCQNTGSFVSYLWESISKRTYFSWGREGVSSKGDWGSCLDGGSDSVLFVVKHDCITQESLRCLQLSGQNIPNGVRVLSLCQRDSSRASPHEIQISVWHLLTWPWCCFFPLSQRSRRKGFAFLQHPSIISSYQFQIPWMWIIFMF